MNLRQRITTVQFNETNTLQKVLCEVFVLAEESNWAPSQTQPSFGDSGSALCPRQVSQLSDSQTFQEQICASKWLGWVGLVVFLFLFLFNHKLFLEDEKTFRARLSQ